MNVKEKRNGDKVFMSLLDTIAAVSTPYGKGGIAVLRVSGDMAADIAGKIFKPECRKSLKDIEYGKCVYGKIYSASEDSGVACRQIDDGIAVYFKAPHSFTGEDTVEISCHGGILVTQKVLTALQLAGARAAGPGEFTKRAFINGKIKLSQAEALGNLLEAENDEQIAVARSGMNGALTEKTQDIYNSLRDVLAAIFAHIDYPDEDLAEITQEDMIKTLKSAGSSLEKIASTYMTGKAIAQGVNTVICGKTNAGKSSVYNRIVGRDAAIVTDVEGTTRDILCEKVTMGKVMLRLFDTAGIRSSDDPVETIGIERAHDALAQAELVFAVFDGSKLPDDRDFNIIDEIKTLNKTCIAVINKIDLGLHTDLSAGELFDYSVCVSAKTGEGFDRLCELVNDVYIDKNLDTGHDALLINARQYSAVTHASKLLEQAVEHINLNMPLEICCADVESAMQSLGDLDGREVSEDIVEKIFSSFCVGK